MTIWGGNTRFVTTRKEEICTLERPTVGNLSQASLVSYAFKWSVFVRCHLAAVTVDGPMPSPMNRMRFCAFFRLGSLPLTDALISS